MRDGHTRLVQALLLRAVQDARCKNKFLQAEARAWIYSPAALDWADGLGWPWPPRIASE